jgi:hypothetical protein
MSIKIFIGTSPDKDDYEAEVALEYSLRKHASEELEIIFMRNREDGFVGKLDNTGWATPFTNLRWVIPEYCNFEGRAIYMDVDKLNLRDIVELYNVDMQGKPFASRENRLCVMVFDNEKMKSLLAPIEQIKRTPGYGTSIYWDILKKSFHFDPRWNCLDGENRPIEDIWHLHFTSMPTQPWAPAWGKVKGLVHRAHPRKDLVALWETYRDEGLKTLHNEGLK